MKKIPKIITVITIILFFFTGCDKYHRDTYTGTWEFTIDRIFYNEYHLNEIEIALRDTVYYTGKILTDGDLENGLLIKYTESDEVYAWIKQKDKEDIEDGEVFLYTILGYMCGKYPSGKFEGKDKLCLELYWGKTVNSLIEGPYKYRLDYIIGTKKSKKNS